MRYLNGYGLDVPVQNGQATVEHPEATGPDCGGSVRGMEQMLADLGYYTDPIDSFFGPPVFAALSRFMKDIGVPYRRGTYPSSIHCAALIAAWQHKQAGKGAFPSPGMPVVMPGLTPDAAMAAVQAAQAEGKRCAAAANGKTKAPAPAPAATAGFGRFGRLGGFGAFGATLTPEAQSLVDFVNGLGGKAPLIYQGVNGNPAGIPTYVWQTFLGINPSSQFDQATTDATKAWQQAHPPLVVDGKVGPQTWATAATVAGQMAAAAGAVATAPGTTPGATAATALSTGTAAATAAAIAAVQAAAQPPTAGALAPASWWSTQTPLTQMLIVGAGALVAGFAVISLLPKPVPMKANRRRRKYRANGSIPWRKILDQQATLAKWFKAGKLTAAQFNAAAEKLERQLLGYNTNQSGKSYTPRDKFHHYVARTMRDLRRLHETGKMRHSEYRSKMGKLAMALHGGARYVANRSRRNGGVAGPRAQKLAAKILNHASASQYDEIDEALERKQITQGEAHALAHMLNDKIFSAPRRNPPKWAQAQAGQQRLASMGHDLAEMMIEQAGSAAAALKIIPKGKNLIARVAAVKKLSPAEAERVVERLLGHLINVQAGTAGYNNNRRRLAAAKKKAVCHQSAPKKYRRKGATRPFDYADIQCLKYPIRFRRGGKVLKALTKKHIRVAASRFGKHWRKYPVEARRRIAKRIRAAERKYRIGTAGKK